jgi:hypothetical protein
MTNKELINVIGNIPEEMFVPERFSGISFSKVYFNPALDCHIFIYWDNLDINYEVKVRALINGSYGDWSEAIKFKFEPNKNVTFR